MTPYSTPAPGSSRTLGVGGERVHVIEAGDRAGSPVIMLHGWGASAYNFRRLVPLMVERGFRVLAPDLRGHGDSARPQGHALYSVPAAVAWTRAVADDLGLESFLLVGQSIGGAVALDAFRAMPDRVRAVALFAPIGFTPVRRVALGRVGLVRHWQPPTTPRWLVRLILRRIYGTRGRWSEADVEAYHAPLRRADTVAALLQWLREFDFTPRPAERLRHLAARMVIRFGERDRLIPWRAALRHAEGFPGADVAVIPGAGHVPAEEVPDVALDAVLRAAARATAAGR